MVGSVNRLRWLCLMPVAMPVVLMAQGPGEFVRDPTRPAYVVGEAGGVGVAASSRLSSIVRREGRPPQAVVDGVLVSLGGKVGDARLVRIHETTVVLQSERGSETLMLTPGIEKTQSQKHLTKKPEKTE